MWKKDRRYHVSEEPFNENMTARRKVGELQKDGHYSYVSFVIHITIIEKGWIDASFLQGLKHNTWVAIPGFAQNGLNRRSFMEVFRLCSFCPCTDASSPLKLKLNLEACFVFVKFFWFLRILKQAIQWGTRWKLRYWQILVFLALNHTEGLMSIEQSIKSKLLQANTSENKAVVMLDRARNWSKAFDMQIAEPILEFRHSFPIPVAINTSQ